MENGQITVTSPLLPDLGELNEYLRDIWSRKWITNNGHYHQELERALCEYLKVPYISLFTNGTLPLITALQALRITGEVITTPFSFVATTHSIWWNGIKPVFVDIDPSNCGMDPDRIEAAITPKTTAIMPVHCYGKPCDVKRIQEIADKYGLKVIYDAAHAFGVEVDGESILNAGDMSTLSFHATKVYNTVEGGALVMHDEKTKQRIDYLKNFGFAGETTVIAPGINGKMDEIRSAVGLINLKHVDDAIASRRHVAELYRKGLKDVAEGRRGHHLLRGHAGRAAQLLLLPDIRGRRKVRHDPRRPLPEAEGAQHPRTQILLPAHQHVLDLPRARLRKAGEPARGAQNRRAGHLPAHAPPADG